MFIRFLHHRHRCSDWPTGRLVLDSLSSLATPVFSAPLLRAQEFRANPDATTSFEDESCTALEVALRSYSPRAPTGIAELVRHGAHFTNRCVRKFLPPWTAKSQEAEPQDAWSGERHKDSLTIFFQVCPKMMFGHGQTIGTFYLYFCNAIGPAYGRNRWNCLVDCIRRTSLCSIRHFFGMTRTRPSRRSNAFAS